ncbi:MAG: ATP-binding cassette domain-containing protein [Butyrivibrio sp.]|nr:ATP-binding cassette domain-containing protein [Butyrivibrio sp.]MBP3277477.1 ATP-binding cassette domain-containing protein [Butyrivibrio sp.]
MTKKYENEDGKVLVYEDFSEEIGKGEFVVLTGESGSGKTTLIKMLLKETEPDSGTIFVDGKDISKIGRKDIPFYRRSIGVLFQDFRLIQESSVYDNLMSAILATGGSYKEAEKKIVDVLTMLGIDSLHKRFPKQMSGGEQQKVCLARAIINNPGILLVDEPTGNLDPSSSAEINRLLDVVNGQGITIVMATHDIAAAERPGRRRIDLDNLVKA